MALSAVGLKTHIWNNHLACGFLLLLYPFVLLFVLFLACGFAGGAGEPPVGFFDAGLAGVTGLGPYVAAAVIAWYLIASFWHRRIINSVTKAKTVTREAQPKLYNMLENLCISVGLPMPALAIIDNPALNAFASGLTPASAQITVTTGLLETLSDEELEAVLAHELTHVINSDIELLIVSAVFVGLLAFLCEACWRMLRYGSSGKGKGKQFLLGLAIASSLGYVISILLRFALSRRREYLADAGAVELTKNPDAMASALMAISGKSQMAHVPSDFREMMIDYPKVGLFGMFSTHPPIEKRIEALRAHAGATIEARTPRKHSPWRRKPRDAENT